jgi:hypothetical protein
VSPASHPAPFARVRHLDPSVWLNEVVAIKCHVSRDHLAPIFRMAIADSDRVVNIRFHKLDDYTSWKSGLASLCGCGVEETVDPDPSCEL